MTGTRRSGRGVESVSCARDLIAAGSWRLAGQHASALETQGTADDRRASPCGWWWWWWWWWWWCRYGESGHSVCWVGSVEMDRSARNRARGVVCTRRGVGGDDSIPTERLATISWAFSSFETGAPPNSQTVEPIEKSIDRSIHRSIDRSMSPMNSRGQRATEAEHTRRREEEGGSGPWTWTSCVGVSRFNRRAQRLSRHSRLSTSTADDSTEIFAASSFA